MTPKVAKRGQSFKGAGAYYLHDKDHANTSNRVSWTHTYNHSTDDPQKALNRMAYTAMRADKLKHKAGVSAAGRKARAGAVYTFSLSYHKEQSPTKKNMIDDAFEALGFLDLKDHQAVMVAHNDTEHPHVHVICNLVNPVNGRTKQMSLDRNKFSEWAEKHEREHGKIYCPERVKNNEKRRQIKLENQTKDKNERKSGFVKHRENKIDKGHIQKLYQQSDSAKAFQAALKDSGYELAKGDRRGLVLVDDMGKVHSLSRQMKGLWEKDKSTGKWKGGLQERFKDFKEKDLRPAKEVVEDKQYFDRDKYESEQEQKIIDAAIDAERLKMEQEKKEKAKRPIQDYKKAKGGGNKKKKEEEFDILKNYKSAADEYQPLMDWSNEAQGKRIELANELEQFYNRKVLVEEIEKTKELLDKKKGFFGRYLDKKKGVEQRLEELQMNLDNIDMRIQERKDALEIEIKKSKPKGGQDRRKKDLTRNFTRKPKNLDKDGRDYSLDR